MTPSGKRIGSSVVETNAQCLIEAVRQILQPRHIYLEEGTLAEWLYKVLSPLAKKVVVAAVSESRGPKDSGPHPARGDWSKQNVLRSMTQVSLQLGNRTA